MKLRTSARFLLLVGMVLSTAFSALAQQRGHWTRCDTAWQGALGRFVVPPDTGYMDATFIPYFITPKVGFAYEIDWGYNNTAVSTIRHYPKLYRTVDSGKTWTMYDTTVYPVLGVIKEMYFTTVAHGYLASFGDPYIPYSKGGIFETFDTGKTWGRISPPGPYSSVYVGQSGHVFALDSSYVLWKTTNEGLKWNFVHDSIVSLTGNGENQVFAGSRFDEFGGFDSSGQGANYGYNDWLGALYVSTDNGTTWKFITDTTRVFAINGFSFFQSPFSQPGSTAYFWFFLDGTGYTGRTMLYYKSDLKNRKDSLIFEENFTSLSPTDPNSYDPSPFEGIGCSVYFYTYAQGYAFQRTTDLGKTWSEVPIPLDLFDWTQYQGFSGVSNYAGFQGFSVTGNGAVIYLIDDSGYMWRTTDGGDGRMSETAPLYEIAIAPQLPVGSHTDTLETTTCDSTNFSFTFQYTGSCSSAHLDSVSITGLDTSEYRLRYAASGDSANVPDTGWIAIHPKSAGIRTFNVHCYYIDPDKNVGDTSFSLSLNVSTSPGTLVLNAKPLYDFGTQSLCNPISERNSFSITGFGCTNPLIDSIVLQPDSAAFTDFTFRTVRNIATDSVPKAFTFSFKPSMADTEHGSIFVYWNDGEVQHVDTIRIEGAGVENTRSFSIQPPAITVQQCDSSTGTIYVANTTCGNLELDSLTLPKGLNLAFSNSSLLPINLTPGSSDSVFITISPGAEGTSVLSIGDTVLSIRASVKYTDKGGTTPFDTTISIIVHVERGAPEVLLSDSVLNFGKVSTCDSATLPFVISSTGCDTLSGIAYQVSGTGYRIANQQTTSLPTGTSDTLEITFAPNSPGTPSGTLVITSNAGTKSILLSGIATAGLSTLTVDTATRDFGSLYECESRDTIIWLSDSGCQSLSIDSAIFSNSSYRADTTFPIALLPNTSVPVKIHLTGSAGMNGSVTFYSNANSGNRVETVPFLAQTILPAMLHLTISSSQQAPNGQLVTFYFILTGDTGSLVKKLSGLIFTLSHNNDLLSLQSTTGISLTHGAPGVFESDTLSWNSTLQSDTIGSATFRVYLSDSATTPLIISDVSLSTPGFEPECIASIDDSASGFTYLYQCGDHGLQGFLQTGTIPFYIDRVVPDPASTSLTINGKGQAVEIQLDDVLGRNEKILGKCDLPSTFDISKLSAGTYYLLASQGGFVETRRVLIVR